MALAEAYVLLLSHMNVNKCSIQITHLLMLKRTHLNQKFSVFCVDKHLLTDMGETIVRKYVHTTEAQ